MYPKTKGRAEEAIDKLGYSLYAIFRPGLLMNREGEKRKLEAFFSKIPLGPKIEANDMGRALLEHAIKSIVDH